MNSSDTITTADSTTTQLPVSKEEHANMNSRNFSQGVRTIKSSKSGVANGCEYSPKSSSQTAKLCVPQSTMLHGSVMAPGEHVKDEANGGDPHPHPHHHHHHHHQVVVSSHKADGGRERLKRHREEVAGRVLIPDKWGQEELLKDWIDCSAFEALLVPNKIALARKALAGDGRGAATSPTTTSPHQQLRIESRC